jgi:hypothetical protein
MLRIFGRLSKTADVKIKNGKLIAGSSEKDHYCRVLKRDAVNLSEKWQEVCITLSCYGCVNIKARKSGDIRMIQLCERTSNISFQMLQSVH